MRIQLTSGRSFDGTLMVRNVTGIAEQRGFRLYWNDPESDGMIGVDGECSCQLFRTASQCAHSGLARFGVWPDLYLDSSQSTRTMPGKPEKRI